MPRRFPRYALCALALLPLLACAPASPGASAGAFPSDAWFVKIGQCEQPADTWWTGGVDWTIHGPGYEGGLGFAVSTWDQYGPGMDSSLPDNAGDATPAQQIVVARRLFHADNGHGGEMGPDPWGCSPVAGPPF